MQRKNFMADIVRLFGTVGIATLVSACTTSPEERRANLETRQQIANILASANEMKIAPALRQCINFLEGQPVDEAALYAAGFEKKTPLVGTKPFYKRTTRRAGIARAEIMTQLNTAADGGSCLVSKDRNVNTDADLNAVINIMGAQGYTYEGLKPYRLGRRNIFSKDGRQIAFSSSGRQYVIDLRFERI